MGSLPQSEERVGVRDLRREAMYEGRRQGVGQDIVDERIRVLNRRARVGTTGVYLDRILAPDEGFESVLEDIIAANSLVRRRIKKS